MQKLYQRGKRFNVRRVPAYGAAPCAYDGIYYLIMSPAPYLLHDSATVTAAAEAVKSKRARRLQIIEAVRNGTIDFSADRKQA